MSDDHGTRPPGPPVEPLPPIRPKPPPKPMPKPKPRPQPFRTVLFDHQPRPEECFPTGGTASPLVYMADNPHYH
jgi:hypothetical protein